jgi:hypothetical protein
MVTMALQLPYRTAEPILYLSQNLSRHEGFPHPISLTTVLFGRKFDWNQRTTVALRDYLNTLC